MAEVGDFYEDDEPVAKLEAAFERGDKATTFAPPQNAGRALVVEIA